MKQLMLAFLLNYFKVALEMRQMFSNMFTDHFLKKKKRLIIMQVFIFSLKMITVFRS